MIRYHPRMLAHKLEELVPELQSWSHRASIVLQKSQIRQKRIEDRLLQTNQSVQVQEDQLAQNQASVQQQEVLLQGYARNCQQALEETQRTANATESILNEARAIYNRMLQALHSAQEVLTQVRQASTDGESGKVGFASVSGAVRAASAQVAHYEKAVALANQALQLAEMVHQRAQVSLKASEDAMEFIRAASKALAAGKQTLGKEENAVRTTLEALQQATLTTQESTNQLSTARSHEQPAQLDASDALRMLQEKIDLLMLVNRPELEASSDPVVALLQLAAVADPGGLTETLDLKLEKLLTKLDGIDGLKPYRWDNLGLEERVEVLQNAHNVMAAIYRFEPSPVGVATLPPKLLGDFTHATRNIRINRRLVAGDDRVEALATLLHESRHAYQWHLAQHVRRGFGWHSESEWTLAQEWSDNFYNPKSAQLHGFREYRNQPVEEDAFSFEKTVVKLLFGK